MITESRYKKFILLVDQALREVVDVIPDVVEEPPPPPPPPKPVVNPFAIAYNNTTNLEPYKQKGSLIVCGRNAATVHTSAEMQGARAAGAELFQYLVPSDCPNLANNDFDRAYYGTNTAAVPKWPYANGTRYKWPGTLMTDMRPGSPWIMHTVEFVSRIIREGKCDGIFLDTVGARTYFQQANWDSWSDSEKDAYTLGNIDLVRRLAQARDTLDPNFKFVNNSVWHREVGKEAMAREGEKYVEGSCLEHHLATSVWHQNYARREFSGKNRRMLIIAGSTDTRTAQEDAVAWAKLPGVTHVMAQPDYRNAVAPAIPFNYVQA
jgi:hypothetical protein